MRKHADNMFIVSLRTPLHSSEKYRYVRLVGLEFLVETVYAKKKLFIKTVQAGGLIC